MEFTVRMIRTVLISLVTAISGTLCIIFGWHKPAYYLISRYFWSPLLLFIANVKVDKSLLNASDLPPCIFYSNHRSHYDIPTLMFTIPRPLYFLAKKELKSVPFLGWGMMAVGMIFIDRKDRASAIQSMERAGRQIKRGKSIVTFPEGTRSSSKDILPFKKGTFHLAKSQGIPLVPIAISGSEKVLPKHGKLRSGRIKIKMGEPLSAEEMKVMDLPGLRDEAFTRLQNLVHEADNSELAVKPESA